jgi:hypothetical protein
LVANDELPGGTGGLKARFMLQNGDEKMKAEA